MLRVSLLAFALAIVVGCKKKEEESSGGGGGSPSTERTKPREEEKPKEKKDGPQKVEPKKSEDAKISDPLPEVKFTGLNEWCRVGDVQVRITKGKVMNVPLKTLAGTEYVSKEPHLVLVIEIQNLSKVKKLDYSRWRDDFSSQVSVTDEHDNKYRLEYRDNFATETRFKTIQPEGAIHKDMICIEPPVAPATQLKLVLPNLVSYKDEPYRFKIPSSAWK